MTEGRSNIVSRASHTLDWLPGRRQRPATTQRRGFAESLLLLVRRFSVITADPAGSRRLCVDGPVKQLGPDPLDGKRWDRAANRIATTGSSAALSSLSTRSAGAVEIQALAAGHALDTDTSTPAEHRSERRAMARAQHQHRCQ